MNYGCVLALIVFMMGNVFADSALEALSQSQMLLIEAQQRQAIANQNQRAAVTPMSSQVQSQVSHQEPVSLSLPAYLINRYMSKTITYTAGRKNKSQAGVVAGVVTGRKNEYFFLVSSGKKIKINFVEQGYGVPSNRLKKSTLQNNLEQQVQMQQMISQSLSGMMSADDESSVIGNPAMLAQPQAVNQSIDQSHYSQLQSRTIQIALPHETIMYYTRDSEQKSGILDYVGFDHSIILKNGVKVTPIFKRI